jgi:hypothetical protein
MNEIQLRDGLFELFPPDGASDWEEVLRRAARPRKRLRRFTLLLAAALLVVLAVGSALALSGQLGGLLHGTPVNDLTPREKFLMTEFDMKGRAELIATRGSTAFYVIRKPDGRLCYSVGENRGHLTPAQREENFRFGGADCLDPRVFPSRAMPVLSHAFFSYQVEDSEARMAGLNGFAADPVEKVGVIGPDNKIAFTIPVEDNVFSAGKRTIAGGRGIVALGMGGRVLWVQCFALGRTPAPQFPSGGCGQYKNSPPPNVPAPPIQSQQQPLPHPLVTQSGTGDGVSVRVHGGRVEASPVSVSASTEALLRGRRDKVNFTCFKLVKVAGREFSSGVGVTRDYGPLISARLGAMPGAAFLPPYDGCTLTGLYGHTWGDAHGTHDAVEVPLTSRGRRWFAERAVARDLQWLARARAFYDIRYGVVQVDAAGAAKRLGPHVVVLRAPQATPAVGKLGIWMGPNRRIVLVERTPTGRRFYVELRRGIAYRTNLSEY